MLRKIIPPLLTGLGLAWAANAPAATVLFDFNSDPSVDGLLTTYGSAQWIPSGGVGSATNANDGYLEITPAINSKVSAIIFSDFDSGAVVQGFTFEADVRIGNGTQTPADGFSINYVRASDPILAQALTNPDPGSWTWGTSPAGGTVPEEGSATGVGVGFDAYENGGGPPPDIVGLDIRVDGTLVLQYPMPTLNGALNDPTSIQTGTWDGTSSPDSLGWAHVKVDLNATGILNVWYKNILILSNFQTSYFPSPGRLVFGGRTGGLNENQDVDNIKITTIAATLAQVAGTATGFPDGVSIQVYDSGASVVDTTKPMTFSINGGPAVAATSSQKNANTTTVTYHGYPTLLVSGSTNNQLVITVHDSNNNVITATRTFTVPVYGTLPLGDAVTGVDTTKTGFRVLPWQSGAEPNRVYWVQEQLIGLHGANNANLGSATDGGYIDFNGVLNFNISPASASGGDAGNFTTANGYADSLFPGIPGANTLNGSTALEVLTFLEFKQPGLYQMGVNSDDGFAVTEGKNPRDRLAQVLGQFDGGRGSSDSLFYIAVTNAGIYPFRLIWENGNGELPGNGANLEWFMVDTNGVKMLVNDPSPTNDTGVAAYFAGPALPAFVSQINPYIDTTRAVPTRLAVQLTDGVTTVNGNSIKLSVDGAATPAPAISKSGAITTAVLDLFNQPLPSGSQHTATLVWSDSAGTAHSNSWPFTVESYVTGDSAQAVPPTAVDNTKPGFALQVAQIDFSLVNDGGDYIGNNVDWANAMLAGSCFPWYGSNVVDTSTAATNNTWYWTDPIDFNIVTSPGDFSFNFMLPGLPGVTGSVLESFAAGFDGWLVFPKAGYYRMSVSSDDNFRLSQGLGVLRQVLHIKGAHVDRDVAADVSETRYGNGGFGAPPPLSPITAPVFLMTSNNYVMGRPIDLTGKIAVMDSGFYGAGDALLCYIAQTNGALAFIELWPNGWGCPNSMGGTAPGPITIPALDVNSYNGERNTWVTNTDLVATIGASQNFIWGSSDPNAGRGMGRVDIPVLIPAAGAYPLHLTYEDSQSGAGLEWQTYQYDGLTLDPTNMVVINDTTDPVSLKAYRAVTVLPTPTISLVKQGGSYVITYTGVLKSSPTANGTYQPVSGASGGTYTVPTGAAPMMFYRAYNQ